ncbi:uncharacterized protein LOC134262663 [Saccostrea cucullata]|uniref:uncharacterized protein LOC134262663 n=1 Tax=Saccostrea cuccullata TaxID=36930 RepID=UPI002ED1FE7D
MQYTLCVVLTVGSCYGILVQDPQLYEQRLGHLESLVQQQSTKISELETKLANTHAGGTDPVYFSAYSQQTLRPGNHQAIVYDSLYHDSHNAYDQTTGFFTAPVKGFYVFAWTTEINHGYIFDSELLVNGARRQKNGCDMVGATQGFTTCTGVVPLELKVGDVVYIRSVSGNYVLGNGWLSFTGWLVHK